MTYSPGFGSRMNRDINNLSSMDKLSSFRVWKRLHAPEHVIQDPLNPFHQIYTHIDPNMPKTQMARRMDRKVIKLEAAYGSDRQPIVIKRNQDLIVKDLMEDVQRTFRIPQEELVIFHKGTNLCDFPNETLENLGIENNHQIRVTQDTDLPNRSPRNIPAYMSTNNQGLPYNNQPQQGLDPISYLKEISPQRVPDPTPYQIEMYNKNMSKNQVQTPNDVLKIYAALGSEREYILVHGRKPLVISDLKMELSRVFKIPPDQQCIVFKGYNLHEYLDDAPLETFGLENNSPISLWPKGSSNNQTDVRLPRGASPPPGLTDDVFSPRIPQPPGVMNQRTSFSNEPTEVLKLEIQHGSDRIPLILKGQNKTLTVFDLQNELERVTAVPLRDQRLYFRSQELHLYTHKTLRECGLENNNVVKLVGEPSKIRYSNYFGRLNVGQPNPNDAQFFGNPEFQRQQFQQQQQYPQQQYPQQQYPQQQQYQPQQNQFTPQKAFPIAGTNRTNQSQVFGQAPPSNRF